MPVFIIDDFETGISTDKTVPYADLPVEVLASFVNSGDEDAIKEVDRRIANSDRFHALVDEMRQAREPAGSGKGGQFASKNSGGAVVAEMTATPAVYVSPVFLAKIAQPHVAELEVEAITSQQQRMQLSDKTMDLYEFVEEDDGFEGDTRGLDMTQAAIDQATFGTNLPAHFKSSDVVVIIGDDGIAGAMSTRQTDLAGTIAAKMGSNTALEMEYVGTTGLADGAGTRLYAHAITTAAANSQGIVLVALDSDAGSYWGAMGFHADVKSELMYLTPTDVTAYASAMGGK